MTDLSHWCSAQGYVQVILYLHTDELIDTKNFLLFSCIFKDVA